MSDTCSQRENSSIVASSIDSRPKTGCGWSGWLTEKPVVVEMMKGRVLQFCGVSQLDGLPHRGFASGVSSTSCETSRRQSCLGAEVDQQRTVKELHQCHRGKFQRASGRLSTGSSQEGCQIRYQDTTTLRPKEQSEELQFEAQPCRLSMSEGTFSSEIQGRKPERCESFR